MLTIVGGTYREICHEPQWNELYGSGFRAAEVIGHLAGQVRLVTLVGPDERRELLFKAKALDISLTSQDIAATVRFVYNHPLAIPNIYPSIERLIAQKQVLAVTEQQVLCYGMLEGEAVIHGEYVVYDPQSPNNPLPFAHNGSTAQHLAIVLNQREGQQLTNQTEVTAIGQQLLAEGAEVVVIKQGTSGATVFEAAQSNTVPAYKTTAVWPIGSGDVFSAVFAYYWMDQRLSPTAAATKASLATAYYCQTQSLHLPREAEFWQQVGITPLPVTGHTRKKIYLAGPFFTMAERWLIQESLLALQQTGNAVFSPLHDVGHGMADVVVPLDLQALQECDAVFAVIDGLDSGTLFEVGYARAQGTPVVAFVQNETPENLKMLEGSGCLICSDFSTAVYTMNWLA